MDVHRAKRCGAITRSGKPCQSPAMANGRCRMHGGPSPGAPKGNRNAYKHGRYPNTIWHVSFGDISGDSVGFARVDLCGPRLRPQPAAPGGQPIPFSQTGATLVSGTRPSSYGAPRLARPASPAGVTPRDLDRNHEARRQ
ncbi:HGGxSTG domain-containing protein [Bradyrhizobium sp. NP1]|uniref:HGGxSTG domain-containing protein n=1 Tax=Bradyrhizobium sp. NP1 TaxID=3049772 RepID=UPI0025A68CFC|nr:HGGxSTG domain-containing protein [Bradyrhizobium sp. NP1]WJR78788.1 HGGxSTG domain-containing protein [Bradyrhizobium sp. NP1]